MRVFVSHSSRDRTFVDGTLMPTLKALQQEPWYAHDQLRGGEEWEASIRAALDVADLVAVVVSRNSLASTWVKTEVMLAASAKKRLLPITLDDTAPEHLYAPLIRLQRIDGTTTPAELRGMLRRAMSG